MLHPHSRRAGIGTARALSARTPDSVPAVGQIFNAQHLSREGLWYHRAMYRQLAVTIFEAALAFFILFLVAYAGGMFAVKSVWADFLSIMRLAVGAEFLSVARCWLARNILTCFDVHPSGDLMSREDAEKLWKRLLRYQRLAIWSMTVINLCITCIYFHGWSAPLRSAESDTYENPPQRESEVARVYIIIFLFGLFTTNFGILLFGMALACRSEWLGFVNVVPLRSFLLAAVHLSTITYEELLARAPSDERTKRVSVAQIISHQDSCVICLSEFQGPDVLAELPCNHFFHESCARSWFAHQPRCPYRCRESSKAILQSMRANAGADNQGEEEVPVARPGVVRPGDSLALAV